MEKLAYLLYRDPAVSGDEWRETLIEAAAPAIRAAGGTRIGLSVDDDAVAAGRGVLIRRSEPPIRALVCFWLECADDRGPCEEALAARADRLAGYVVAEARPLVHAPPVGRRAPGFNLVTAIERRPGISDAEFFDRWNREHRAVALETQSTSAYVRNAILRPLTDDAPPFEGVVEESFPIEALTDPEAWYDCVGDPEEYRRRLARMVASVRAFLDLDRLESTPMSEYFLG